MQFWWKIWYQNRASSLHFSTISVKDRAAYFGKLFAKHVPEYYVDINWDTSMFSRHPSVFRPPQVWTISLPCYTTMDRGELSYQRYTFSINMDNTLANDIVLAADTLIYLHEWSRDFERYSLRVRRSKIDYLKCSVLNCSISSETIVILYANVITDVHRKISVTW